MKINKLHLIGFIGIRAGLGRDEVTLDLQEMTGDDRLIALVGANGRGKTTIMDNLHPYRLMPSRATSYSPGAFSYYENLCLPDCLKELEFEHQGETYLSSLVFKINGRRKAEAYLHVRAPESQAWEPVKLPDGTISDGKAETYDRCIEALLGSPETFFTSQFSAQNRRSLSSYTNGEIKTLMADLLGLAKIRETGAKASQVVKLLKSGLDGMRGELARLSVRENELPALEAALSSAQRNLSIAAPEFAIVKQDMTTAQAKLAEAKSRQAAAAETEGRRSLLLSRRTAEQRKLADTLTAIRADIAREELRITRYKEEAARESANTLTNVKDAVAQIERRQSLLARKGEIEDAEKSLAALRQQEIDLLAAMVIAKRAADERQALVNQKTALQGQLEGIEREGAGIKENCEGLKTRAALTDQVPCKESNLQPRCPLMREALAAKAQIPVVDAKTVELRQQYRTARTKLEAIDKAISEIGDPVEQLKNLESQARTNAAKLRQAEQTALLRQSFVDAEEAIKEKRQQIDVFEKALKEKQASILQKTAEAEQALLMLQSRLSGAEADGGRIIADVSSEIASLPPAFDAGVVAAAEQALRNAESVSTSAEVTLSHAQKRLAECEASLASAKREVESGAASRAKAARIEDELAQWSLLAKAFGNDGIVALSIDDAGPTLASLANDLLLACYGPRFTVSIQTQVEQANGNVKEGFDIIVFDAEQNDSKSVTVMSGGEKVWINECLTRAIALYLAQSSGRQYLTLFSDEADGPLDPDRKRMFINMKRKVLELGGYEQEFFVSQTPDLWQMADKVIHLNAI